MPEFTVYEVVREIRYHKWRHMVDAESAEEALTGAKNGSAPCHCGELGEPEEVCSGWAVREWAADRDGVDAWDEAYQNCEGIDDCGNTPSNPIREVPL